MSQIKSRAIKVGHSCFACGQMVTEESKRLKRDKFKKRQRLYALNRKRSEDGKLLTGFMNTVVDNA